MLNDPTIMLKTIRSLKSDSNLPRYNKLENCLISKNKLKKIINNKTSRRKSSNCTNNLSRSQGIKLPRIKEKSFKENVEIFEKINMQILKEYSGDDKEFEREIIEKFIVEIPKYLKDLQCQVFQENFLSIKKAAHKMKAPVAMFGLNELKINLKKLKISQKTKKFIKFLKSFLGVRINSKKILKN